MPSGDFSSTTVGVVLGCTTMDFDYETPVFSRSQFQGGGRPNPVGKILVQTSVPGFETFVASQGRTITTYGAGSQEKANLITSEWLGGLPSTGLGYRVGVQTSPFSELFIDSAYVRLSIAVVWSEHLALLLVSDDHSIVKRLKTDSLKYWVHQMSQEDHTTLRIPPARLVKKWLNWEAAAPALAHRAHILERHLMKKVSNGGIQP